MANSSEFWLAAAAVWTLGLWIPYIAQRAFLWGFGTFLLSNYPPGFPAKEPEPPLWAVRAKRAHLNMVETFGPFAALTLLAIHSGHGEAVAGLAALFFVARVVHAGVYILGIPGLRTPAYLVSWAACLGIAAKLL